MYVLKLDLCPAINCVLNLCLPLQVFLTLMLMVVGLILGCAVIAVLGYLLLGK
jgi:hypothetical protein